MKVLINESIAKAFSSFTNLECVALPPYKRLSAPVACHADMLFCVIDDTMFCYEDYVKESGLLNELEKSGKRIVYVSNVCEGKYPSDIGLNVLIMGKTLFCNVAHTSKEILEYAKMREYEVINVKQGYSACSTLVIDENNAVTADMGMYKKINECGKKALLISNEGILLDGYNCGFVGGASSVIDKNIYFFGDINTLGDHDKIKHFVECCGGTIFSISSGRVYDFGGIKLV